MTQGKMTRRTFVFGAALATAAAARPKRVSANDKLNIAIIGAGGRGKANTDALSGENIVALCDVDWMRAAPTFLRHPKTEKFRDWRVMLDKCKDIDAVVVSTPDHMHAFASMAAIQLGKHVYCEKPLTHSVWEARRIAEAAREANVATQMGNGGQAEEWVRVLCEYLWAGAIGPVHEVHVWTNRPIWPQAITRPQDTPPVPDRLSWDLWLGPAPERPYHPAYLPFKWRGWFDFGTGALGDIGCHAFHPVFRAMKFAAPDSVEATSTRIYKETYPAGSVVRYQFPAREDMPPCKLIWYDGGLKPEQPPGYDRPLGDGGTLYIGEQGMILGYRIIPEERHKEFPKPPETLPRSPGHYAEWTQACKGGAPAGANFDMASLVTETVLLGNVALRVGQRIAWDCGKLEVTNVPEANQLLRRDYREGWTL